YVDRILKGAKPAEMSVQAPTKYAARSSRCSAARRRGRAARPPRIRARCRASRTARSRRGILGFTHLAREGRMTVIIGRRELLAALGGAAVAWPLAARAQQAGKTPRVGYIRAGTPNNDPYREEFVRGMRDLGYVEGRNIAYEFRHYGDDVESIPSLIGDLLSA